MRLAIAIPFIHITHDMALRASTCKTELNVVGNDRACYGSQALTVAPHGLEWRCAVRHSMGVGGKGRGKPRGRAPGLMWTGVKIPFIQKPFIVTTERDFSYWRTIS